MVKLISENVEFFSRLSNQSYYSEDHLICKTSSIFNTLAAPLVAPSNFTVQDKTAYSVTLQWDHIPSEERNGKDT